MDETNHPDVPNVVYHGTNKDISGGFHAPAFFAANPQDANYYANWRGEEGARVYPTKLNMKNPLDARSKEGAMKFIDVARRAGAKIDVKHFPDGSWDFDTDEISKHSPYDGTNLNDLMYSPRVRHQMHKEGYDGLMAHDQLANEEVPIFVPLHSHQIKHAIGKEGGGSVDQQGITAYHGSPHDFEQFDTSKIGTGEGAQVYGHGLYFAEHEPVAKKYRDDLAGQNVYMIDHVLKHAPEMQNVGQKTLHDIIMCSQTPEWDPHTAAQWAQYTNTDLRNFDTAKIANTISSYRNAARGHIYEVHINAHPHHFLDWDKPLAEQSEHVQKVLSGRSIFEGDRSLGEILGRAYRNELFGGDVAQMDRAKPHEVSAALSNLGIKGIKYLDEGSRGRKSWILRHPQGGIQEFPDEQSAKSFHQRNPEHTIEPPKTTHNYVVFNDKDVHVKRKYEQGGRVQFGDGGNVDRRQMNYKDVTARIPELTEGANRLARGEINKHEYQQLVNKFKPVHPYESVPELATFEQMLNALAENKREKLGQSVNIPEGHPVGLRLDIPSYKNHGVWVPTIHNRADKDKVMAHDSHAMVSNAVFSIPQNKALKVAMGTEKSPFATIDGEYNHISHEDAVKLAAHALHHPEWTQVGMDPERHGFFYDRRTQRPIKSAAKVLQVGPLVLAHNAEMGDLSDPEYHYEQGGRIGFDIGGAVPEVPTLGGVQAFFDQANLVNQQRDAQASQVAYQQALAAQQQKEAADAAAKAAASAKPKEGLGSDVGFGGGGGGGEGGGGGGIGGGLGSDFGGGIGGRDSNNADATGTTGGNAGEWRDGGRVHYNTGGPVNVSKAEDTAGNFKKEHERIHGIPVAIEVKDGHDRVKYNPDGSLKFKAKQYADYGAILGTKDADGMDTDVMVGPHKDSERAYIIDQRKHKTGKFDEHKVLLGFKKRKKAIKAYIKSYADRHGKDRVQDVVKTDIKGLKKWLKNGDLKRPAAHDDLINSALRVVSKKA